MHIAMTHAFCWPEVRRGAERLVPSLGAALVRRGHDVTFFSASRHPGRRRERGVRVVRFGRLFEDQYRHELHFGLRMLPRLATEEFDVVHSFGRHDAVASILAKRVRRDGRLTVFTDTGNPDRDWWRTQGFVQSRAVAKVVADIDVYSCLSQFALDTLASTYGRTDATLLPGGVELDAFLPAEARQLRPTILFSGAFAEPRKGVADLLTALPIIAASEPDVLMWLSGPGDAGPLLAAAPEEARRRVRVLGLGDVDRQHERYGRAWVTCLPSTDEAFGLALLESLACGTPIVATDHAAPSELVREGVTGELCPPHDPEALAAACLRALALARRRNIAERCRHAAEPYDFDAHVAPRCEALYQRS
jgi:phosphatidylinositol alpha-mannosyltransferase